MSHANLSRRALVRGAAAVPAVAGLSAAIPALASAADSPDAQLLALRAELDRICEQWLTQRALDDEDSAIFEARVFAATGIAYRDAPAMTEENRDTGYWAVRDKVIEENPRHDDPDPDLTEWDQIHDRMFPLVDKILAYKAQAVAGLAVQAQAMALCHPELWDEDNGNSEEDCRHRLFIEAVCAFVGVKPVAVLAAEKARKAVQS
jgi:hypothetical protein